MAITSVDGKLTSHDDAVDRQGAGTIGDSHLIPFGSKGGSNNAIIDDQDPAVKYGIARSLGYSGVSTNLTGSRANAFDVNGSTTKLQAVGAAVQYTFSGTSIAILGRFNNNSSNLAIYVDGVLTKGRVLVYGQFDNNSVNPQTPLPAIATTVPLLAGHGLTASGEVLIGNERITYTSIVANVLQGCTRGANKTTPVLHYWTENVYQMDSTAPLNPGFGNPSFSQAQAVWYSPFLDPGNHTITIVLISSTEGGPAFWFDGFIVGSMFGSSNIVRSVGTVTVAGLTDGAGFYTALLTGRSGPGILAFLGFNLLSSGGGVYPVLEVLGDPTDNASVALRIRGSINTNYSLQLVINYIGEAF